MLNAKKVKTFIVWVMLAAIMASNVKVSAASSVSGYTGGVAVSGSSHIGYTNASAYTGADSYNPGVTAYVSSTYTMISIADGTKETRTKSSTGTSSTSVFFSYTGYRSYEIISYHWAQYNNATPWSGNTSIMY